MRYIMISLIVMNIV